MSEFHITPDNVGRVALTRDGRRAFVYRQKYKGLVYYVQLLNDFSSREYDSHGIYQGDDKKAPNLTAWADEWRDIESAPRGVLIEVIDKDQFIHHVRKSSDYPQGFRCQFGNDYWPDTFRGWRLVTLPKPPKDQN